MKKSSFRLAAPILMLAVLAQLPLNASEATPHEGSDGTQAIPMGEPQLGDPTSGEPTTSGSPEKGRTDGDISAASTCSQDRCWYEAGVDSGYTYNCVGGYTELLGRSWVGWRGNLDSTPTKPNVNEIYYAKIGWGISGRPCGSGGAYVHPELYLPANTVLAINNQNPVRCIYYGLSGGSRDYTTDPVCPQQPQNGQQGGYAFGPAQDEAAWPTATGAMWELFIPIKTTKNLTSAYSPSGPCASCLGAAVWMIDGNYSPWSYPRIGVYVDGGPPPPPAIAYPAPSVSGIEYDPDETNHPGRPSKARTTGYVFTEGTGGTAYFDIGKTKNYELRTDAVALPGNDAYNDYSIFNDWRMQAGQTWHWRLCYKPTGQPEICGADQSFKTAPAPDTTSPQTTIEKGPKKFSNSKTAEFELSSNELDVTYECQFDGNPFSTCESSTPTYENLADGTYSFAAFAKDASTNSDTSPATWEWTVDTVKPDTSISGGPSGTVTSDKATFKFGSSEPKSSFSCSLDGAKFKSCSNGVTYKNLAAKKHTFKVKAKDRAGNVDGTPATREWKVI